MDANGVALVDLGRPFGEVPLDDLRILDEEPTITAQEAAEFEERARLSFIDPNNFDIDEPEHLSRDSGLVWERTTGRRFRAERPDHRALMDRLVAIWNQKRPVATRRLDVIQAATDQLPEELVAVAVDVLDWYGLSAKEQAAVILKLGADWADNRRGERIYDKR